MRGPSTTDTRDVGRVALVGFFLLTFALTWAAWLAVELAAPGQRAFAVGGPVFLLGVFAPGLVALGLTAHAEGRTGVLRPRTPYTLTRSTLRRSLRNLDCPPERSCQN